MGQNASNIDLSRYSEGNPAIPGVYDVSVYVNDQPIINQSITFVAIEGKERPCLYHIKEFIAVSY